MRTTSRLTTTLRSSPARGTIGRELEVQLGDDAGAPLTVVCPVGGGGLAAGLGLWASGRADVRVVGVEAAHNPAVAAAVDAGQVVDVELSPTLADGLAGGLEPGSVTVPVVAETVAGLVTVTEEEIRAAMRHLALERGVVAEGAGAVGVAAVLAGKVPAPGPVVAVVTGRNVTASLLTEVLAG
ncbi:pyridoxal-phosphate dependent enzyme [Nocardioides sp. TF02-7]|uniref:pyridoxal-phosphate dependent enzyme n=1 Tax=Nocardioides sp. TF02-7 TaxID=2917724 RepID=UPI001F06C04A|nr:pyridoxal-phosphate dependent enzyme [Nocardioides sp. TF02-7]UMG92916.1 pyridoxal-phosphate dependent enzyme [Nocardioides sp. TF02-7]